MKKVITLLLFSSCIFFVHAQVLVSRTLIGSYTKAQVDSILDANGIPTFIYQGKYDVDAYKVIYNTQDYDSTIVLASGLLAVSRNLDCPLPMISYGHGTTSVQEDVPSRLNGEGIVGLVSASNGVVMCEPDYLGMGDGAWPHYYLHAYTQAMCNINLIRAAREICAQDSIALDGKLYLGGYSQGGFQAMATHKYIQERFANEFNVTASFPGAGSYDMSGAMVDLMLSDLPYPSPGYLPFLVCTWNHVYNFYTDPAEYFVSPYDTLLPSRVDGLNSIGDLNNLMPDTPKLIFKQAMIDSFASNPNHPLRLALTDNDVYKWVPQAPVTLLHCANDRQVPKQNTYNAYNYFVQNGAMAIDTFDPNPALGHGDCGEFYFIFLKNYLDTVLAANGCLTSAKDVLPDGMVEVFPNPVHDELTLRSAQFMSGPTQIVVCDIVGHQVYAASVISDTHRIKISGWSPGTYLLQYSTSSGRAVKKILVE
ncbi:MAG TPA: T9SS type A sorting domain-containing protein [Chitinophagales bacterium]|nr:T9SS type A sorting domain-containing protein [Chitinophagales bacterium]